MSLLSIIIILAALIVVIGGGTVLATGRARRRLDAARPALPARPGPPALGPTPGGNGGGNGPTTLPPQPPAASSNTELERRSSAIDQQRRELERADRLRSLLVAKMGHDLRTPLNSVITLSQLMADGTAGSLTFEQRKYVEIINRNGKTLLGLVSEILDLAALETGRLELDLVPLDVRAIVRDVAERGTEIARRKGLPLRANVPRAPIMVRADDDRLRQVLLNLIDHAVAQTSNGYVEVQADAQDQAVNFRVTDTGPGIPGELPRTRLEDFLDAPGGAATTASNLGLLLAERLVKLMGGDLSIENVSGEGTTFLISLPAAPMEETGAGLPAPEEEPVPLARAGGQVLLVDDDDVERAHVTTLLERAGYDVSAAKSGDEGLGRLRQQPFDAVVLDLVMPGMSGLDVLRAARLDERLARLPFVVLSALYMTKSEREVLGPSVAGVVRRGERIGEELLALLRHAVETSEPSRPARAPAPAAPTARVLVVEDDDDNLFTIKQVLASLPVQLETATTAREAIAICASRRPDLVVMDVELPDVSGLDAARDIRRLPSCGEIPIIALTARATPADREEVLAAHFADYLPKPLQPREVVGAVSRALHLGASDRLAPHPPGASPTR